MNNESNILIVYKLTEDLLNKIYPTLTNFPKSEKFSLCQSIKNNFFELLGNILSAHEVKSKRRIYLDEAMGKLRLLQVLINLSQNRRYISEGFFRIVDLKLSEIKIKITSCFKNL